MTVSGGSSVQTVPDADENYTGGGGTGEGGSYYEDKDGNIIRGDEDKKTSRGSDAKSTGYDGTILMKQQKILLTDMRYKLHILTLMETMLQSLNYVLESSRMASML